MLLSPACRQLPVQLWLLLLLPRPRAPAAVSRQGSSCRQDEAAVCQACQPAWQHPPAAGEAGSHLPAHAAHLAGAAAAAARRRYQLPPTFCLPPGIDDCLVHFLCFYCASHQVRHVSLLLLLHGSWSWQLGSARRQALALLNCWVWVLPGTAGAA